MRSVAIVCSECSAVDPEMVWQSSAIRQHSMVAKSVDETCLRYVASFIQSVIPIRGVEYHASIHCAQALPFRCIFIAGSKCSQRVSSQCWMMLFSSSFLRRAAALACPLHSNDSSVNRLRPSPLLLVLLVTMRFVLLFGFQLSHRSGFAARLSLGGKLCFNCLNSAATCEQ